MNELPALSGLGPAKSADGLSAQLDLHVGLGKVLLQGKVTINPISSALHFNSAGGCLLLAAA